MKVIKRIKKFKDFVEAHWFLECHPNQMKPIIKWGKTDKPLPDGWYWWRASEKDTESECLEVINDIIVGTQPMDSHGAVWEVYEHADFSGEWWGPLEVPK